MKNAHRNFQEVKLKFSNRFLQQPKDSLFTNHKLHRKAKSLRLSKCMTFLLEK